MKRLSRLPRLPRLISWGPLFATLLLATMGAGPCGHQPLGDIDGGGGACTYRGQTYASGASFPAGDGCNTCSCGAGGATCSAEDCKEDARINAEAGISQADASTERPPCIQCGPDAATPVCAVGFDQTCNEDPAISSLAGRCLSDGTCSCSAGVVSPFTGRCLNAGDPSGDGCEYAGVLHPVGAAFSCADGCSTCTCVSRGQVVSTACPCGGSAAADAQAPASSAGTACPRDAGSPPCALDDVYVYGNVGGLVAYTDQVTLTPPASYVLVRTATPGPDGASHGSCAPPFPACGDSSLVDVSDVLGDLSDPAIQRLLANPAGPPTLLGLDTRPVDGPVFAFKRGSGAGFLVGGPCAGGQIGCTDIPAPVARLVSDLRTLDRVQMASPSCAAFAGTP
jgi:hypothetical protein